MDLPQLDSVICGDARKLYLDLPKESVDLIFTDLPYTWATIHLYADLARIAGRVLKPGCLLFSYCGSLFIPAVFEVMRKPLLEHGLDWFWMFRERHNQGFPYMFKTRTLQMGKCILAWSKGKPNPSQWKVTMDEYTGGKREKALHKWQQSVGAASYYLRQYTVVGNVVLDPFCGSGTTLVAAEEARRHWIGYDIDPVAAEKSKGRMDLCIKHREMRDRVQTTFDTLSDVKEVESHAPAPLVPSATPPKRRLLRSGAAVLSPGQPAPSPETEAPDEAGWSVVSRTNGEPVQWKGTEEAAIVLKRSRSSSSRGSRYIASVRGEECRSMTLERAKAWVAEILASPPPQESPSARPRRTRGRRPRRSKEGSASLLRKLLRGD